MSKKQKRRQKCILTSPPIASANEIKADNINLDFLKLQYQVLSDRRINHNSMLWNTPSLLFLAQTLLWTISLGGGTNLSIRCLISLLSIFVAIISLQSFERHRIMEVADAEQMYSIELLLRSMNELPVLIIHHTIAKRDTFKDGCLIPLSGCVPKGSLFSRKPAFRFWKAMFECIIGVTILITIYNFYLWFETYLKPGLKLFVA